MNRLNLHAHVLGYTTLRLAIGMSMFMHGIARVGKIPAFTQATVKMFAGSPLPLWAVADFTRITPFVELLIGVLLILGLATALGLILGGLWMIVLIFGSTLIEQYDTVGIQLIYSLIFYVLLQNLRQNMLSMDRLFTKKQARE
jgi:thiosulfate dehydrogenase [quinone] large subunit